MAWIHYGGAEPQEGAFATPNAVGREQVFFDGCWEVDKHKSCYGTVLPSVLALRAENSGKAFSVILRKPHGAFVTDRRVKVGMEQWDDCRACEEFADCHKLCTTQLALESAVWQL